MPGSVYVSRGPARGLKETGQLTRTSYRLHGGGTHSYYNGLNLGGTAARTARYVAGWQLTYRGGSGFGPAFRICRRSDWANGQALRGRMRSRSFRFAPSRRSSGKVGASTVTAMAGSIKSGRSRDAQSRKSFDAVRTLSGILMIFPGPTRMLTEDHQRSLPVHGHWRERPEGSNRNV